MSITNENVLWERIQGFSLDEFGSVFPFSARLARENDWNKAYTQRVIEEYKRFAFLAIAAGHPVTPSVDIDQVWHLHLCYTKSYWEGFCGEVLKQSLHHGPTKGGRKEKDKFHDWYARTLASYEHFFAEKPPKDIWPPVGKRFAKASRIKQVSTRTHWVIPKPRFLVGFKSPYYLGFSLLIPLIMIVTSLLLGNTRTASNNNGELLFLGTLIVLSLSLFVLTIWLAVRGKAESEDNISSTEKQPSRENRSPWSWFWLFSSGDSDSDDGDGCGGCGCGCG